MYKNILIHKKSKKHRKNYHLYLESIKKNDSKSIKNIDKINFQ